MSVYRCWLHLANGWTVSITADDTPPALCSVAAWPTPEDEAVGMSSHTYFRFADRPDALDLRCFSLEEVRQALLEVEGAPRP